MPLFPRLLARMSCAGPRKPHILLVPDRPGWAYDFLADDIAKWAADRYDFTKYYKHAMPQEEAYRRFDAIYFFWWAKGSMETARGLGIPRRRRMSVVSSHQSFLKRGWGDAHLRRSLGAYAAVGAVNRSLHDRLSRLHPRTFLTRHGVDPSRFYQKVPIPARRDDGRLVAAWAGSLKYGSVKGLEEYIVPAVEAAGGVELRLAAADASPGRSGRHYGREEM